MLVSEPVVLLICVQWSGSKTSKWLMTSSQYIYLVQLFLYNKIHKRGVAVKSEAEVFTGTETVIVGCKYICGSLR